MRKIDSDKTPVLQEETPKNDDLSAQRKEKESTVQESTVKENTSYYYAYYRACETGKVEAEMDEGETIGRPDGNGGLAGALFRPVSARRCRKVTDLTRMTTAPLHGGCIFVLLVR